MLKAEHIWGFVSLCVTMSPRTNCLLGASALQWHLSPNRPQAEPWISRPPTPESILRPLSHLPHPVIKSSAFSRCLMQTHRKASPSLPFSSISHQPPKYIPFSPLLLISEHACPKPGHSPPLLLISSAEASHPL